MRRTRESITNEYNKFKGLKAEINKLKASPDYEKVDKKIKKDLVGMWHGEWEITFKLLKLSHQWENNSV